MKRLAPFLIAMGVIGLCLFLFMTGCNSSQTNDKKAGTNSQQITERQDASELQLKDYTLAFVDGNCYLRFEENQLDVPYSQIACVSFESIDVLVEAIRNCRFSETDYSIIRTAFPKNENGIMVFDIDHAYDAESPTGFRVESVGWYGPFYTFRLIGTSNCHATLTPMPRDYYQARFAREYETFFDREQIRVTKRELVDDRNAEIIWFETDLATLKQIRYTLSNGVIVEEEYRLTSRINAQVSETVPLMINLFGEMNGSCFCVTIDELNDRPSVEWLSQFGVSLRTDN